MFEMRGRNGELKLGYQAAALLGPWQMNEDRVDAEVRDRNDAWLGTGGPFALALQLGRKMWVWREVQVYEVSAERLSCRVNGRPEVRDAR